MAAWNELEEIAAKNRCTTEVLGLRLDVCRKLGQLELSEELARTLIAREPNSIMHIVALAEIMAKREGPLPLRRFTSLLSTDSPTSRRFQRAVGSAWLSRNGAVAQLSCGRGRPPSKSRISGGRASLRGVSIDRHGDPFPSAAAVCTAETTRKILLHRSGQVELLLTRAQLGRLWNLVSPNPAALMFFLRSICLAASLALLLWPVDSTAAPTNGAVLEAIKVNPLFPFSDRLPSVFSALGEKAIS